MKRLAILGASGHGKVVADTAQACGWQSIVFFDDASSKKQINSEWTIKGDTNNLLDSLEDYDGIIVAIGNNKVRHSKIIELKNSGARLVTIIHPDATVSSYSKIGSGSVVFAGAVVNIDMVIGEGAILNTGCSVDHDCVLGDAVHISPGARLAGGVKVGDYSWIGIGSSVRGLVSIGSDVTVGAGAAVVSDVRDSVTVVGVPAREQLPGGG